jgi:hypothetical protein
MILKSFFNKAIFIRSNTHALVNIELQKNLYLKDFRTKFFYKRLK